MEKQSLSTWTQPSWNLLIRGACAYLSHMPYQTNVAFNIELGELEKNGHAAMNLAGIKI